MSDVLIHLLTKELRTQDSIENARKVVKFDSQKYRHLDRYQRFVTGLGIPGYNFWLGKESHYIHAMLNHVGQFVRVHGSILPFTQQGLEKLNDVMTKHYFRATSHQNEKALLQMMEHLQDSGAKQATYLPTYLHTYLPT